jgi:signal transduction histidine kinase
VGITLTTDQHRVVLHMINDLDAAVRGSSRGEHVTPGFGLRGLMDRTENLSGSMKVSCDGQTFELTLRLPRSSACSEQKDTSARPTTADRFPTLAQGGPA